MFPMGCLLRIDIQSMMYNYRNVVHENVFGGLFPNLRSEEQVKESRGVAIV
jgi:hypothetical protein